MGSVTGEDTFFGFFAANSSKKDSFGPGVGPDRLADAAAAALASRAAAFFFISSKKEGFSAMVGFCATTSSCRIASFNEF